MEACTSGHQTSHPCAQDEMGASSQRFLQTATVPKPIRLLATKDSCSLLTRIPSCHILHGCQLLTKRICTDDHGWMTESRSISLIVASSCLNGDDAQYYLYISESCIFKHTASGNKLHDRSAAMPMPASTTRARGSLPWTIMAIATPAQASRRFGPHFANLLRVGRKNSETLIRARLQFFTYNLQSCRRHIIRFKRILTRAPSAGFVRRRCWLAKAKLM